jgi:hypothetical protein
VAVPVRSLTITVQSPSSNEGCTPKQQSVAVAVMLSSDTNCQLPIGTIVITNGAVAAHIDVTGSDAIPADGGKHWTLCGGNGTTCTGKNAKPGPDQYQLTTLGGSKKPRPGTTLSYDPQCDAAYDLSTGKTGCTATPKQTANEGTSILVPSSSTDPSSSFTSLITWTAIA